MAALIFSPHRQGFWSSSYQAPPKGWIIHSLAERDCSRVAVDVCAAVGWVVEGDVDLERLARALKDAVSRRLLLLVVELGGQQVAMYVGPPYEIHVPLPSSDVQPFSCSISEESDVELLDLLPYVRVGTPKPAVSRLDTQPRCLQPLLDIPQDINLAIKRSLPLLYLHFVKAKDATLICLAWRHIVMDASGAGKLVQAWQEELSRQVGAVSLPQPPVQEPSNQDISKFLDELNIDPSWTPPHSFKFTIWGLLRFSIRTLIDESHYRPYFGSIYVPASIVKEWKAMAIKELGAEQWVTRNDLACAWIYKTAFSIYPPDDISNLSRSINIRGKHPSIPQHLITNLVTHCVHPALPGSTLLKTSLPSLALGVRGTLNSFTTPSSIALDAAFQERSLRANDLWILWENVHARCCYFTSWANLGLTAPSFGPRTKTVAAIPLFLGMAVIIIDDEEGGWRVYGRLPKRSWEVLEEDLEKLASGGEKWKDL